MKIMRNVSKSVLLVMSLLLCGCSSALPPRQEFVASGAPEEVPEASVLSEEKQEQLYLYPQGQPFVSEMGKEGVFEITIESAEIYDNWKDANVSYEDLNQSADAIICMDDNLPEGNLFNEDGSMLEGYRFLLLHVLLKNQNAISNQAGDIFNLNNLVITEKELLENPDSVLKNAMPELEFKTTKYYRITYSNQAVENEVWKVCLPVGETLQVDLGYLVKDYGNEVEGHTLIGSDGGDRKSQVLFDLGLDF